MTATPNREYARLWFSYAWHPAAILLFLVTAYVGMQILPFVISGHLINSSLGLTLIFSATLVLFAFEIAGVISAVALRDKARAAWQALAIAILAASVIFAPQILRTVQITNLLLFPSFFAACEHNAQPYGGGAKFKSCIAESFGDAYFVTVYDSGGEIGRPANQQSQPFKDMLKGLRGVFECKLSPGQHLRGAFYLVDAACDW